MHRVSVLKANDSACARRCVRLQGARVSNAPAVDDEGQHSSCGGGQLAPLRRRCFFHHLLWRGSTGVAGGAQRQQWRLVLDH